MNTGNIAIIGGQIIGLISVVGVLGMICYVIYLGYKEKQLQHKQILAAIEKGVNVPFPEPKKKNYRNQGLVWFFVGLALVFAWSVSGGAKVGVWGLIPLAVGVALLLMGKSKVEIEIETKKN